MPAQCKRRVQHCAVQIILALESFAVNRPKAAGHQAGLKRFADAQAAPSPAAGAPGIIGVTTYQVIGNDSRLPVPDAQVYPFRWACTPACTVALIKAAVAFVHPKYATQHALDLCHRVHMLDNVSNTVACRYHLRFRRSAMEPLVWSILVYARMTCTLQDSWRDPVLSGTR